MNQRLLGLGCGDSRGSAEILLKSALRSAQDTGASVELVRLQDIRLPIEPGDSDRDMLWLWERLAESDGVILSTPVISRSISPRLKMLGDLLLGPNADAVATEEILAAERAGTPAPIPLRADERVLAPRVTGFLAVGGSKAPRWRTLTLPLMHVLAFPMRMSVIDQAEFTGGGSPRSIVLDDKAIERAALLGQRVATQLGRPPHEAQYLGEPGLCPMCHLSVIVLHGVAVECATCGAAGELGEQGAVRWTDLDACLGSMAEKRAHFTEMLETGGAHVAQRARIEELAADLDAYDPVVHP
ncbi:flavodoxin family protein [Nocardia alni]|uniref:flavodoxin family protein n=1 Tax=Nocardia alni TaxID=2815723 RepID=UPI001C2466F9|nr:NAD(P)H-dependent oxidoreductase [Nocardia alni]